MGSAWFSIVAVPRCTYVEVTVGEVEVGHGVARVRRLTPPGYKDEIFLSLQRLYKVLCWHDAKDADRTTVL